MMKKYFGLSILTIFAVVLMSSSAHAVIASLDGGNVTVSSEMVSTATAFTLPATAVNNAYQPAGAVAATKQISITLTGGTFGTIAGGINMCDSVNGLTMGTSLAVAAGATTTRLTTLLPLSLGVIYNFQVAACPAALGAPTPLGNNVRINAGAASGTIVYMTIDNYQAPGDPLLYAIAPVATVVDQFSAVLLTAATETIDFSALPVPLGKFKAGGSDTVVTSKATVVFKSNEALGTRIGTDLEGSDTTCTPFNPIADSVQTGTGPDAFTFTATPTIGTMGNTITSLTVTGATASIVDAAIASTDASASGWTNTDWTAAGSAQIYMCGKNAGAAAIAAIPTPTKVIFTIPGTSALQAKTYTLQISTKTGGDILAAPRVIMAATTAWTWGMDAVQFYVPFIKSDPAAGKEFKVKLQSKSTVSGTNGIVVSVLCLDGLMHSFVATEIVEGTTRTITAEDMIAGAALTGGVVDAVTLGFAAIITVNTPGTDVFAYAQMVNVNGEKRVPVQRLNAQVTSTIAAGAGTVVVPTTIAE